MAEASDSTVRLLAAVSKLLARLSADEVDKLLTGESKLAAVPQSWRPTSKRSVGAKVTLPVTVTSVQEALDAVTERGAGIEYLNSLGLTVPQVRQLGRALGVQVPSRLTKAELIETIVNSVAGSRLSSDAIREGNW